MNTDDTDDDRDNGISCSQNYNPFDWKNIHQKIAQSSGHPVYDLSRGDPDFPAHHKPQRVHAYLSLFAQELQSRVGSVKHLSAITERAVADGWQKVSQYFPLQAQSDARQVMHRLETICQRLGINQSTFLASFLPQLAGTGYGQPEGELPVRAIVVEALNKWLTASGGGSWFQHKNVVITNGCGEAIGAVFGLLSDVGYLRPGDKVAVGSPLYSPYASIAETYGLELVPLHCNPEYGFEPGSEDRATFGSAAVGIKLAVWVDPSNPTGRKMSTDTAQWLAEIVEREKAIVVLDTVYMDLLPDPFAEKTLLHMLPEQTLLVSSLSKVHRLTGLRFGYIAYTPSADAWLRNRIFGNINSLQRPDTLQEVFNLSKTLEEPLSHVTMASLPSQWQGAITLLLAEDEGPEYRQELERRNRAFREIIGLPAPEPVEAFVPYYVLLNLRDDIVVPRARSDSVYADLLNAMDRGVITPLQILERFAEAGVVVLYAAPFFAGDTTGRHAFAIRVSIANQPLENVVAAAHVINAELDSLARACAPISVRA
jgi:aspartate/methionine/tyrosine aminotransferase